MKKLLLPVAVVATLALASCGSKGWSDEQKKTYMDACVEPVEGMVGKESAEKICNCGLEKLEAKYPNPNDIDQDEARKIGEECAKEFLAEGAK